MVKVCEECQNKIGDGFPYGDITCMVDGKMKHESRKCDNGCFLSKDVVVLLNKIKSEAAYLKQEIKSEYDSLWKEIEMLRCCGNCKEWVQHSISCPQADSPRMVLLRTNKCDHWQKL